MKKVLWFVCNEPEYTLVGVILCWLTVELL